MKMMIFCNSPGHLGLVVGPGWRMQVHYYMHTREQEEEREEKKKRHKRMGLEKFHSHFFFFQMSE